ncbi:folylpolyglutamate synthase, mitochondrial-like isoform X1 [Stegodyphus dumicola]|uniref:folylpolyglutamate synthase, mitochondrial-like isoform X1 n=1 Tax=Stegodyphus dumicola TaxID=202533 RepID=UPI0015AD5E60|nr:folylpolyglutamate synthase, mitochondrial-like isoform X1 [Stegodyphus dumicola]
MDKDAFTKYFWKVYRAVESSLKDGETMPPYFMFLTIMAFYVFVMERVEAAVIEVGIGGLYDCTNIIRNPVAVGITTLGIDHVSILGDSLAEIAAQKAGIFKPGVPAFTVSQQESAMRVLREQSRATGCPLVLCPPIEAYEQSVCLGVAGAIQSVNASLALQLSKAWLNYNAKAYSTSVEILNDRCDNISEDEDLSYLPLPIAMPFKLDAKFQEGLKSCVWPGRFQTVEKNKLTFYLDGAHTQQSIRHCIKWFNDVSQQHRMKYQPPVLRILLFNCTGERKAESLLDPLADAHFDLVIFSPNRLTVTKDSSSDLSNFLVEPEKEMQQCITNKEIWNHLIRSMHENELNLALNGNSTPQVKPEISAFNSENSLLFSCLSSAINWLNRFDSVVTHECDINDKNDIFAQMLNNASHIQVLVTGSLHLVGGVLKLIQS